MPKQEFTFSWWYGPLEIVVEAEVTLIFDRYYGEEAIVDLDASHKGVELPIESMQLKMPGGFRRLRSILEEAAIDEAKEREGVE